MTTSIYISTENIIIASGKELKNTVMLNSFNMTPLPSKAVVNGMVIRDDILKSSLKKLRKNRIIPKKNVKLVIDRSTALIDIIKTPILKSNTIIEHIKSTFAVAAQTRSELIYDYSILEEKDNTFLILASAIERDLVEDYNKLFLSCGIRLSSIDIAVNSVIRFQNLYPCSNLKTFILTFVDENSLLSFLFVDGKYRFSKRYRLLNERGTAESALEFSNFLSTIMQFNKAQGNKEQIECAYLCGLNEQEDQLCYEIAETLGIKTDLLKNCQSISIKPRLATKQQEIIDNLFVVTNIIE